MTENGHECDFITEECHEHDYSTSLSYNCYLLCDEAAASIYRTPDSKKKGLDQSWVSDWTQWRHKWRGGNYLSSLVSNKPLIMSNHIYILYSFWTTCAHRAGGYSSLGAESSILTGPFSMQPSKCNFSTLRFCACFNVITDYWTPLYLFMKHLQNVLKDICLKINK